MSNQRPPEPPYEACVVNRELFVRVWRTITPGLQQMQWNRVRPEPWPGTPVCENDTDGDGDCHLCHRKGGCPNIASNLDTPPME